MSDISMLNRLADNAQLKADKAKAAYEHAKEQARQNAELRCHVSSAYWRDRAASDLNDTFYWLGHVNAYRGVAAGLELREMVEEETDNTPSCP